MGKEAGILRPGARPGDTGRDPWAAEAGRSGRTWAEAHNSGDPVPEVDLGSGPLKPTSPWSLPPARSRTDPGQTRSRRTRTLSSESPV